MLKKIDFHVHMGKNSKGSMYTVEDLLQSMDSYGIEYSGLSILNGVTTPPLNDRVMEIVRKYPQRIAGFAFINPREDHAIDEVHRCLQTPGMRGVKFHSWKHGYSPDNISSLDAVLNAIEPYKVPVLCHTGTAPLALPQQWAAVAARHPGINFIFAHIGYLDFGYGCVECAKPLPNVYVDTSGQHEIPVLEKALEDLGPDRIIFASDWPYKYTKSEICKLDYYGLSDEDQHKIFYGNAHKLLKL